MGDIRQNKNARGMKEKIVQMVKVVAPVSWLASGMLMRLLLYGLLPVVGLLGMGTGTAKWHASMLTAQLILFSTIGVGCFM